MQTVLTHRLSIAEPNDVRTESKESVFRPANLLHPNGSTTGRTAVPQDTQQAK